MSNTITRFRVAVLFTMFSLVSNQFSFGMQIDEEAEKKFEAGEYAFEYLKRVSNRFRLFVMLEGSEDELELIPEIQWHINRNMFLKAGSGFGVTSKAADIAPEVGIMFLL